MSDVPLPQLGETVTEGTITRWFKQVGDSVEIDEALFEVSTDKVDSEVPSPVSGVVTEILVPEGETVDVGTVLAKVGESAEAPAEEPEEPEPAAEEPEEPEPAAEEQASEEPEPAVGEAPARPGTPGDTRAPAAATAGGQAPSPEMPGGPALAGRLLSPVVRRLIRENNLDPDQIEGTGVGGRITRTDVLNAIDSGAARLEAPAEREPAEAETAEAETAEPAPTAAEEPEPTPQPAAAPPRTEPTPSTAPPRARPQPAASEPGLVSTSKEVATSGPGDRVVVVPFNNIRRRTGEFMVNSVHTSPHVLTVMEVDYENVERVRRPEKESWKATEGYSLTYLPFIARAVIDAIADYPDINAQVEGDHLLVHKDVHLGIAVDLDMQGLIVPVVRNADTKRMRGIAREINDLANRARRKQLGIEEISGGTFTITNNGTYGTFTTSAIINQPQVAILSTDGVSRRPVVVTDDMGGESLAIHSVGHLSLSWDHRAFDGSYSASFLRHVKEIIETRDWASEV